MIHGNQESERWALFMAAAMARSFDSPECYADRACDEYNKRFTTNGDKRCQNVARNGMQCGGAINHRKAEEDWLYYEEMCDAGKPILK